MSYPPAPKSPFFFPNYRIPAPALVLNRLEYILYFFKCYVNFKNIFNLNFQFSIVRVVETLSDVMLVCFILKSDLSFNAASLASLTGSQGSELCRKQHVRGCDYYQKKIKIKI